VIDPIHGEMLELAKHLESLDETLQLYLRYVDVLQMKADQGRAHLVIVYSILELAHE
jgi:hypothetical protein